MLQREYNAIQEIIRQLIRHPLMAGLSNARRTMQSKAGFIQGRLYSSYYTGLHGSSFYCGVLLHHL